MSRSRRPRLPARSIVALLLAVLALAALPASVAGHAELVSSTPAPNASLAEAPERVTITFSEPIDAGAAFIDLLDPEQGRVSDVGAPEVTADGREATVTLPELDPGIYTVTYQVVSTVDGHATTGRFAFLVDPTGASAPPTTPVTSTSPSVDPITVGARWVGLAGLLVALGTLLLWLNAARPVLGSPTRPPWTLVVAGGLIGAGGVAAYLWLAARPITAALGDQVAGLPFDPAAAFGWTPFAIAMRVAILAALAAAAIAWVRRQATDTPTIAAVGVLLAIALAGMSAAGHAASYGGPGFAAIDWLHLLAAAAWLGALPAALLVGRRTGATGAILRRHGRLALLAAPIVALTGIANSPLVLGSSRNLVASDYGDLLLVKATLLSVAVGIGAVNHFALRNRGRARIALLVSAELVVAALAVGAAATMVTIQPASARQPILTAPPVNPAHLFGEVGPARVHATVNLPTPSNQVIQVSLLDSATGVPREDVQKVFINLQPPPGSGLSADRIELTPDPAIPGLFIASGAFTPVEGDWTLNVIVRRAGELDESVAFEVPVATQAPPEPVPPPDSGVAVPPPLGLVWQLLPPGPLVWLPAVAALVALGAAWLAGRGRERGRGWTFGRGALVALFLVAGLGAASRATVEAANAPSLAEAPSAPPSFEPATPDRGEALYLANCSSCHGLEGAGDGPIGTLPRPGPLAEAVPQMTDAEVSYRIANGVAATPMPAFAGRLTQDERWELVAYLRSRWGSP